MQLLIQENLKILSEGDLQSCVYYHIRKEIDKKKYENWYVLNKLYMGNKEEKKKVPDIAISYLKHDGETVYPKILLELKETIKPTEPKSKKGFKKDIEKLKKLIESNNKIDVGYFLLAVLPNPAKEGTSKRPIMFSDDEIKEIIYENNLPSKIRFIVINSQYDKKGRINNSFRYKHGYLRKYRFDKSQRKKF